MVVDSTSQQTNQPVAVEQVGVTSQSPPTEQAGPTEPSIGQAEQSVGQQQPTVEQPGPSVETPGQVAGQVMQPPNPPAPSAGPAHADKL